ncbi:LuxR C-terminal-related transcriptional regulator [Virgibacillus byunsanensis]|uniref:LuxR C-terminal-related transcriptional regulator n=1 Tax=Virgibacillus byunsanensis TaxID=570945 RepID=A0ABW3LQY2_9BACI
MTLNTNKKIENLNDVIQKVEGEFFVGRKKEINLFSQYLQSEPEVKVLYIYGAGGIGKTYLIHEYSRVAKKEQVLFLTLDSRDFPHTPEGFTEHIITLIETSTQMQLYIKEYTLRNLLHTLTEFAANRRIIIAIDTYEYMEDLDRWFRQVFLAYMPQTLFVILAGRKPLTGEWIESPAWRKLTKQIELEDFTLSQTREYLDYYGIENEELVNTMWNFTNGHPLALSLAALTEQKQQSKNANERLSEQTPHILKELTHRWLNELQYTDLHTIIEAAAVLHSFDQSSISSILKKDVDLKTFQVLTGLSFVKTLKNGWSMHDLIRDAIRIELKHRNPERYHLLNQRSVAYFYRRTLLTRSADDIAAIFYHLGDEFIQSVFFQDTIDISMYLEPIAAYNFEEVTQFFEDRKKDASDSEAQFYNRQSNQSYRFYASSEHNQRELELINDTYLKKIGYKGSHLLKNNQNKTIGLSIIVPINENTLEHLIHEPVSRAYFSRLSPKEKRAYSVSENTNAGWFIRMLDYLDPTDTAARSFLLYSLFPLLLSGERIIVSNPLPFFQELLQNFGFEQVPNATHYDYGKNNPSPTYILDVRGAKLASYLKQLTGDMETNNDMELITKTFSLTDREEDIVKLIVDEKSNAAIAEELYVAEITVKKHITRIFKKVNVKNRSQLIKRILELT